MSAVILKGRPVAEPEKNDFLTRIRRKMRPKLGVRSFGGTLFMTLVLMGIAIIFLLPVIFMVNNAFKPINELLRMPPTILVRDPTWDNFVSLGNVFNNTVVPFWRYIFNTFFIVTVGTLGQIVIASMAAYPLAKFEFAGERTMSTLIVVALMFSGVVTAVPNFLIMSWLGIIDTYFAIILPSLGTTLGLFLMRNFMTQVPNSLIESAQIDGAGEFYTLWKIVMPVVKPALLTLVILSFQAMWGNAGGMVIYTETLKPLPAALGQIASGLSIARMGEMMVVALLMFLVPVIVFIIMQSNVMETMTTSGMKE